MLALWNVRTTTSHLPASPEDQSEATNEERPAIPGPRASVDAGDLPEDRAKRGFSNRDSDFVRVGARFDGACMATAPLPAYDIARIRTGQFDDDLSIWQAEIPMDDTPASSKGG